MRRLLPLLLVVACNATVTTTTLGVIDSGIEGVPLPAEAIMHPTLEDTWQAPGFSFAELVDWYKEQMPEGEDFGPWKWCESHAPGADSYQWIWTQGIELLSVVVVDDEPPGVLIGRDQSGPC